MKLDIEPLKGWFGFSRRERRSSAILLLIIIAILAFRSFLPENKTTVTEVVVPHILMVADEGVSSVESVNKNGLTSGRSKSATTGKSVYQKKIPIELNGADSATLVRLPGIGPVLSSRIIKFRSLLGGYASVDQLKEVYGLPVETYNLIKDRVYADTTLLRLIPVNSADYKTLSRLPYLDKSEVSSILKYRELKGKINSISDLIENKLINSEKTEKIRPYLRFD